MPQVSHYYNNQTIKKSEFNRDYEGMEDTHGQ